MQFLPCASRASRHIVTTWSLCLLTGQAGERGLRFTSSRYSMFHILHVQALLFYPARRGGNQLGSSVSQKGHGARTGYIVNSVGGAYRTGASWICRQHNSGGRDLSGQSSLLTDSGLSVREANSGVCMCVCDIFRPRLRIGLGVMIAPP
jgi:hypothetical protein